jgi:hypothetical protein
MAKQNTMYFLSLSALIAIAGSHTAIAGDPDPDPGEEEECTNTETPEICEAEWCHSIIVGCLAFIHPPADHEPIPQEDIDELLDCLQTTYGTHQECLAKVCPDKYVIAQEYPTYTQCTNRWAQEKNNCNSAEFFCSISYETGMHPDLRAHLRAACRKAADNRYKACWSKAEPSYDPGNGGGSRTVSPESGEDLLEGLLGNEVFSTRMFIPAEDKNIASATWIPLPGIGESVRSMQTVLVLPDYEKGIIIHSDPILPDEDGMYTLEFSSESIDRFIGIDHFSVMIQWRDSKGVLVWGEPMEFTIAETDIPGDFDRNGQRDAADLVAFLDTYDLKAPRADLSGDMVVDATDLALFLAEYTGE